MDTYTIDTGNSNSNSSNTSTANLAQALKELVSTVSSRRGQGRDGGQSVTTGSAKANSPLGAINSVCTIVRELPEEDLLHATNILFSLKKEVYQSHYYQQQHAHGTGRQVHTEGLLGFLDQSINLWNAGGTGTAAAAAATTSKAWAAEFSKAREEAVLLVREVVKHVGKSLEEYSECILDIRDTLFGMIKYDSSNSSALNVASIRGLYTLYKLRFSALTDEKSGNSSSTNGTAEELANYVLAKFNSSKSSQTVKGWAFKLACLLCRLYSGTLLKGRGEHVLQTVLSTLDMQFRSPKPDMQVIDGALSGLCSLALIDRGALMRSAVAAGASTDDDDDDDDDKRVQLLYKYMCISLEPIKDLQRYDIPRTGLRVLRMHAGHLLRRHLTEDAERMFRRLCPLCTHVNNRLRHKALMGLDAFLGAVCQELLSGARAPASDKKTFLFLMNGLFRMLESPDSSSREIAMGIRGLGRLAAAMKLFFDDDFIRTRLDSLYLFAERLLPGGAQAEEDALLHTARFVGSYAAIAAQLGSVDETRIGQMERLVCALFQTYPDLHASQKPAHHLALLQMLCAVFGKGNALQSLLSRFVVQGLLMTCGESGVVRTIPLLDKIGSGGGSGAIPEQIPLYFEYVPLWQSLLEPSEHDRNFAGSLLLLTTTSGKAAGPNDDERKKAMDALCRTVYDVFVQGVLHTVQRLDLTYSVRKSTGNSAAQAATGGEEDAKLLVDEVVAAPGMYIPRSPKEMETFLKLVEFLKLLLLLPGTSADAFARWAFIFGREITSLSSRLPLISGFYRLLTVSMKLCEKTKYFSGLSRSPDTCAPSRYESFVSMECEEGEGGGGGVHTSDLEQRRLCKDLYTKFLREVAVRLQQYQDELLCACLELLLEAPCQLLAPCQVVGPLVQAFELGTSYLPIALTALRSLRRWLDYEGEEEGGNGSDSGGGEEAPRKEYESIREFLPNILPCLDDYLLIPARPNAEDQGDPSQQQQSAQSKQWAGAKQRQNKYMALAKDTGVALEDVQEAIVLLLGSLGSLSACMVGKVDLGDEKRLRGPAIAWDKERKIELKLGFGADRATMLLDSLLPRALVLAESSSNRQTKIAACELLHSLLLLMIGLEANSQAANMSRYYEKTLPAVLRLATDTEIVARQLFEPLVVQVIHWFTSPTEARKQKYSENAGYLLEALTENVCAKGQSALRDLCARCIGEYVAWAIKHTPPEQSRSPKSLAGVQVRMLLDRAFTLSRLYDPAKRLGAAITLQKMIVPLREDPGLASLFTLEIAHHALFSLRLARGNNSNGSDNDASTNEDEDGELLAAEMQMVSVVRSLCRVIKHYSQTFIETSKLRNVHQSLEELLCWVLESALTRHEALHHALCFEVLDALVPLLPSAKGSSSSGSGSGSGGGAVDNWPPFTDAVARGAFEDRNMIPKVAVEVSASPAWLGVFASMLDSFTWASTHGLRPSVPGKGVVSAEIDALVSSLSDVSGTSELSSGGGVSERLRSSRREAVRALFDYVAAYTKAGFSLDSVVSSASIPNFLYLFLRCVHSPSVVSCKTGSVAKSRALRSALLRCGRLLCNGGGGYLRDALQTSLRHLLAEPGCDLLKVDFSFAEGGGFRLEFTQELCAGYSDLCDLGLFAPSESLAIGEHIQAGLFDNCTAYTATPAKAALAGVLFGLSLKLVGEEKRSTSFMKFLVSEDTERAQAFYAAFEGRIAAYVLSADNFARFCPAIMEGMARSEILWSLFAGVLSRRRSIQSDGNSFRNAVIGSGELVRTVLRSAKVLKEWTSEAATVESKERATEVLELLARIDQQEFARSCRGCVAEVLGKLLESTSKALKIRALGLLRFVGLEGVSGLRDKVHAIVTYDFPMRSSDLRPGSTACNEYIAMLDEILGALGETGSPALLEELYPVIREKDHMHKKAIAATFRRIEERVPGEQQLELVKVALAGSTERGYPQDLKNALINEVAIPLLDQIPQEYLVRLLCERVGALVRTVAVGVEHGHPPSPQERQHALFDRINAFALLRAAYERLTPELIRTDLNSAYVASASRAQPPKGNELTQAVMRAAHTARSERVLVDDEWATGELVLKYHCFAYSTLAAVVICTQSKEAFYTTLFFKEHPEKDDLIWDNVVDLGKTFRFDVETNFPVATKAVRSLQPGGATTGLPGELARKKRRVDAIRYISSQYLQDSSFSQDLSYMGSFAPPVVAAAAAAAADNDNSSTSSSEAKDDESEENKKEVVMTTAVQRKERIVEVEMDEVNKSFLMAPFMRLLDAIVLKFPLKAEGDVPDWEDEFLEKFKSSETHMNVRIFIAKCLVNRPQVFSVHSQYWIRPVLRFAVSLPQTQGISYFLRDICVLILRWLKDKDDVNIQLDFSSSVQDSNLVSQFINTLMKWSIYSKRSILKSNIEIIKLFVERWRRVYVPDKSLIYNMLNSGSEENIGKSEISARITGLQLLGVVIANGFPFFDPSHDISASSSASSQLRSESQLAEALVENLASPSKDVRSAAAEVIGLVLQSKLPTSEDGSARSDEMEVVEDSCDSVIVPSSQIISPISSLASQPPSFSQQRQQQQQQQAKGRPRSRLEVLVELKVGGMFTCDVALALTSLFKIGAHCPSFVANFASHVFNVLPKVSGELRAMALEVIKWSLPQIDDLPRRLRLSGAEALLRYRDSDSQAFLLEIYRRVLPTLAPDEASRIVDTLCDVFPAHPSQTCRGLYYDVLTALYDKGGNVLRDRVRAPLLVGLADKSSQVRERLLEFWASEDRLGETPSERLVLLMKQGFTPKIENAWLGCATILLLRLCTSSEQKVFDKPLSNCAFRDVDISSNTLLRRAAPIFTPMFSVSASLALQSSALGSSEALWSENNGFVRATQDVIFTPTQAGPMDIGGGSGSSSSIVDLDYEDSQSSRYKSTLLFNYGTVQRGDSTHQSLKRRRGDSDENEEQEPQQQQQQQQQQQSQQYTFLRRRFNPAQATQDIIASVLRRKRVKDARAALAESGKASSVVMMRKYREGELPDIEIKPADILKPLGVLVQHDQVIARYAFYELSNLVLRTVADRDTLSEVSEAVKAMLDESPCTNPSFVSVLHDVLEVVLNKSGGTIIVPPQTVAQSAARSGALHTGILLLENALSALAVAAAAAQRGGEEEEMRDPEEMGPDPEAALKENTEQCWSQLAQLYRRAGETDVVKGIYEKNFSKQPQTIRALEYELVGRYDKALSEFNDALRILDAHGPWPGGKSPSTSECDLWENGRLDCMAKLLQWKPLSDNVLAEVSPGYSGADGEALPPVQTLRKLFDEKYSDVYLGHFVKSQLRLRERWSYLKEFVVASSSISDSTDVAAAAQKRRGLLEDKFGPDLTLLTIAGGDLDNARYAVRRNVSEFVGSWARLHPLAVEARRESLEVLQRITEARELLDACKRRGCRGGEASDSLALQGLLDKWHARTPVVPDISTWDDIASARSVYLEQLSDRYEGVVGKSYFVKEKSNVLYAMAEAAKRFGNLSVCDTYLRMALKLNPDKRDKDFRFIMTSVDLFVLKGESRAGRDEAERFAKALKFVLSKEALPVVQADIANQRKFSSAVGGLYAKLVGVLSEVPDYNAVAPTVSAVLGCRGGPGLTDELAGKALGYLEASISDSTTLSNKEYGDLLLKYALFCNGFLQVKQKDPAMMPGISSENLSEKTTTALIQAMRHGNLEAISRVPRLLSLLSLSPSARGVFSVSVARGEVPAWVFVPWVSQMVGSLDLAEGEAIAPVLVKVAEAYPQAVFYPLNVSSKKAQAQARRLSEPIWAILDRACPLLRKFVRACELSVHPEHRAKDAVAEIKALRQEGKTPEIELRRALQELAEDCFNDADPSLGKYNVEKAREWKLQLRKEKMAFSPDVLPPLSWLDRIAQIVAADKKPERPAALQAYSRWMAAYHAMDSSSNSDNGTSFLEVPGQYNKLGVRPAPERHSMITSFESNVLVMSSLRCPKRIGIVTNDSGIKHFLLKGGEDLRLDERIEQAFTLTNGFLASSDKAQRGLEISTYSVVPLSYRAGIIEWVHGTETFKSLVTKQFIKMKKGKDFSQISRKHFKWVETYAKASAMYPNASDKLGALVIYDTVTRKEAVKELESERAMAPEGLMRRAILDMAFSPEAFICIRHEFARSLSALNITSYVLGIGDRHMDNFLLNSANGRVVGIDFGHAFGTATQFLYIPELMPFRLTRQLVGVLAPHGHDGILKHDMIETLQVLVDNRDLLLDTLAIFVKEPLIAWDSYLQRIKRSVLTELGVADVDIKQWYVREKLALVEKKLRLGNPAYITERELKHSTVSIMGWGHKYGLLDKVVQVAKGDKKYNVRANVGEYCSSVTEQVNCLIDQATDPHILAKTFVGWAPYL